MRKKKDNLEEKIEFVCDNCGKVFVKTKRYINKNSGMIPKFCSRECAINAKKKKVTVTCSQCGKEFEISLGDYNKRMRKNENIFCSRSCAAKYNNKKFPKRIKQENEENVCPVCGGSKNRAAKVCMKCFHKTIPVTKDFELGHYIGYGEKKTYLTHKCNQIRRDARRFMDTESKQEKVCKYCHNHEFDSILEVHHIKGILEFDPHTKISEINSDENLIWLCPNHHAMLEKGLIKLDIED